MKFSENFSNRIFCALGLLLLSSGCPTSLSEREHDICIGRSSNAKNSFTAKQLYNQCTKTIQSDLVAEEKERAERELRRQERLEQQKRASRQRSAEEELRTVISSMTEISKGPANCSYLGINQPCRILAYPPTKLS